MHLDHLLPLYLLEPRTWCFPLFYGSMQYICLSHISGLLLGLKRICLGPQPWNVLFLTFWVQVSKALFLPQPLYSEHQPALQQIFAFSCLGSYFTHSNPVFIPPSWASLVSPDHEEGSDQSMCHHPLWGSASLWKSPDEYPSLLFSGELITGDDLRFKDRWRAQSALLPRPLKRFFFMVYKETESQGKTLVWKKRHTLDCWTF